MKHQIQLVIGQSWHGDYSSFVYSSVPIFSRGGHPYDGSFRGIFSVGMREGSAWVNHSFRVVLVN